MPQNPTRQVHALLGAQFFTIEFTFDVIEEILMFVSKQDLLLTAYTVLYNCFQKTNVLFLHTYKMQLLFHSFEEV